MLSNFLKYGMLAVPFAVSISAYAVDYFSDAQAQKVLFPEADEFKKKAVALSDEQRSQIKKISGVAQRNANPDIWEAKKKGISIGLFFKDEVVGKHEYITYAVAVSPSGNVLGVEIMSYRETHGGEIKQKSWLKNFVGKKISDPFKLDNDVPNITGATLSSRNVLDGVKRLLAVQIQLNEKAN